MAGNDPLERPDIRSVVDVVTDDFDELLTCPVHLAADDGLVLGVGRRPDGRPVRLDIGTELELMWKAPGCLLKLPVELAAVDGGADPSWQVTVTGTVARIQRRDAVRAPARWAITVDAGGPEQNGWTVDVSETGLRCTLPTAPTREDGGTDLHDLDLVLQVRLTVGEAVVATTARLVRLHSRTDKLWEASLQFVELREADGDRVRTAVFARMRELRAQGHA